MKIGEKVTKAAKAQADNGSKAATTAFDTSGKAVTDAFENAGRAASGPFEASLKAVQNYQAKLVQCFQANAEANLQLIRS